MWCYFSVIMVHINISKKYYSWHSSCKDSINNGAPVQRKKHIDVETDFQTTAEHFPLRDYTSVDCCFTSASINVLYTLNYWGSR